MLTVTIAFLSLMSAMAVGLYLAEKEPVMVETRMPQTGPDIRIEDMDQASRQLVDPAEEWTTLDYELAEQIGANDTTLPTEQVPEPATLGLLSMGGLGLLRRRRNRRNRK
jgi:hypothetical protein